jgi:hypothetical protein
MRRESTPWTPRQERIVRDGYAAGLTLRDLATVLDRTRQEVQSKARRMGLVHPRGAEMAKRCHKKGAKDNA